MSKVWHIVLFETGPEGKAEDAVAEVRERFEACVGECDGLEWVRAATNDSHSSFAADWREGIVMQFRDSASRDAYLDHPLHKEAGAAARRNLAENFAVFDIQIDDPDRLVRS